MANATLSQDDRHHHTDRLNDDMEFLGSAAFLHAKLGLDLMSLSDAELAGGATLIGADGHKWHVQGTERVLIAANRPRTEAEKVELIDRRNSRLFSSFFSIDRQDVVARIATDLEHESAVLPSANRPWPRSSRRRLKRALQVFANVLYQLSCVHEAQMAAVRAQLADVGVAAPQIDFMARQAERGRAGRLPPVSESAKSSIR